MSAKKGSASAAFQSGDHIRKADDPPRFLDVQVLNQLAVQQNDALTLPFGRVVPV